MRRLFVRTSLVIAALALGFAGAFVLHRVTDDQDTTHAQPVNVRGALAHALADLGPFDDATADVAPTPVLAAADPPAGAASDPGDAVREFLDFEVARDYTASYGLLSEPDRVELVSRAAWIAQHADLPTVTGFAIASTHTSGDRAEVVAHLTLRPRVSGDGVVPARATATFAAVAEDGGWRVDFEDTTFVPHYAPETRAPAAVRAWAQARVRCRPGATFVGGLLGAPARADALCGADGAVRTGRVRMLPDSAQDQPFLAAFGGEVHDWARVVRVESPVRLDVVVAPRGEHWLVVGVLQASSEPS